MKHESKFLMAGALVAAGVLSGCASQLTSSGPFSGRVGSNPQGLSP